MSSRELSQKNLDKATFYRILRILILYVLEREYYSLNRNKHSFYYYILLYFLNNEENDTIKKELDRKIQKSKTDGSNNTKLSFYCKEIHITKELLYNLVV